MSKCQYEKSWEDGLDRTVIHECPADAIGNGEYCRMHGCCVCGHAASNKKEIANWPIHLCDIHSRMPRTLKKMRELVIAVHDASHKGPVYVNTITTSSRGTGKFVSPRYPCPKCGKETKENLIPGTRICSRCRWVVSKRIAARLYYQS